MSKLITLLLFLTFTLTLLPCTNAADEAEKSGEKIELSALPAPVKDGFVKEVPGGTITSAKKLGGEKARYQIKYKLEGKEHQITLGEDGVPTRKKKEEKGGEEK